MKEKVLELMLKDLSQEKIAMELNISVGEVMRLQEEIIHKKTAYSTACEKIREMELKAYTMAVNYSSWRVGSESKYNELLKQLEQSSL